MNQTFDLYRRESRQETTMSLDTEMRRQGANVTDLLTGHDNHADALTFNQLRRANRRRLPLFKNRKGVTAHASGDGSDWALSAWCNAVCGELGEAANLIKKIERGDLSLDDARVDLAKELADVVTYLDILAFRAGVDLGEATRAKFNEVSARVGCDVTL